ncbi:MAG: L,D-transpeptidase family protein [Lentisphaerae bacterium]|nr:L,D-transpeptidase family protein [Lentisphaerota bacterium]
MKREKSRAGCMTVLFVTLALLVAGGVAVLLHRPGRGEKPEDVSATAAETSLETPPAEAGPPPAEAKDSPSAPSLPPEAASVSDPAGSASAWPSTPVPASAKPPPSSAPPVPAPAAPSAASPSSGDAASHFARARERHEAGDYQAAREAALSALDLSPENPEIEAFLNQLAMPLLASRHPMPEKVDHVVQRGEYLGKLAATYNTPVALIAKANNIQGALIRVGDTLRVLDGNRHVFALEIRKSRNDLLVTLDGRFFKRYRVATGRDNRTPVGQFTITDKIAHPAWHKPGGPPIPYGHPDNLLGTHWLAIDLPGYGLHGTWDPESVGRATSDGCIRLLNDEIEELYTILPRGTAVHILE